MTEREQRLVRRVLLWALALSALAAPRTFAAAPAPVPPTLVVAHVTVLAAAFVGLWRHWLRADVTAVVVVLAASISSAVSTHAAATAAAAGTISTDAVGSVILPATTAVAGVAFLALAVRPAVVVALASVSTQAVAAYVGGGAATMGEAPVVNALRFGLVATLLFAVVSGIARIRGEERDRADAELRAVTQRSEQLAQRDAMLQRLFSEAAHELKNPLAVVRTACETLRDFGDSLDDEQRALVEKQLWTGLDQLQARADRVQVHRWSDEAAPTTLQLHDAVLRAGRAAAVPSTRLDVDLAVGTTVHVDPDQLDHVLENLLGNAVKYGPSDTPIHVTAHEEGELVRVDVHDHGTSLDGESAEHVFEPGFRASVHEDAEGDGLGLSLVARLVHGWGGAVQCAVTESGTTFSVTVPRRPAAVTMTA